MHQNETLPQGYPSVAGICLSFQGPDQSLTDSDILIFYTFERGLPASVLKAMPFIGCTEIQWMLPGVRELFRELALPMPTTLVMSVYTEQQDIQEESLTLRNNVSSVLVGVGYDSEYKVGGLYKIQGPVTEMESKLLQGIDLDFLSATKLRALIN